MTPEAAKMFTLRVAVPGTQIKTGVGVIVRNGAGEILLEKRRDCGLWGLLGGKIDPGESAPEAARREVREESGFEIEILGLVGVYTEVSTHMIVYPDNGDIRQLIDIVIDARITGGTLRLSEESEQLAFFPPHGLPPAERIIPPARQPLADAVAGKRGILQG